MGKGLMGKVDDELSREQSHRRSQAARICSITLTPTGSCPIATGGNKNINANSRRLPSEEVNVAPLLPPPTDDEDGGVCSRNALDDEESQNVSVKIVFEELDESTGANTVVFCTLCWTQMEQLIHRALEDGGSLECSFPTQGKDKDENMKWREKETALHFVAGWLCSNRPSKKKGSTEGSSACLTLEVGAGEQRKNEQKKTWRQRWVFVKPAVLCCAAEFLSSGGRILLTNMAPFLLREYYGGDSQEAARISTTAEASRAAVALLISPIYGRLLDRWGRYPFICLTCTLQVIPAAFLIAVPSNPLIYFGLNQVVRLFSFACWYAYITDNYPNGRDRAIVLGVFEGVSLFGLLASFVGEFMSQDAVAWVALVMLMVRVPFSLFLFDESLPSKPAKLPLREVFFSSPLQGMKLLWGSKVLRATTFCLAALAASLIASSDILVYYFQLTVSMTEKQNYLSALETGFLAPSLLLFGYPVLVRRMRPTRIAALTFILILIAFGTLPLTCHAWMIFVVWNPLSAGTMLGTPSLMSVFTNADQEGAGGGRTTGSAEERNHNHDSYSKGNRSNNGNNQGLRLAGLIALLDLVTTVAPFAVGQMFGALPPRYAWTSFLVCGFPAIPALVTACCFLPKLVAEDRREALHRSITISTTAW